MRRQPSVKQVVLRARHVPEGALRRHGGEGSTRPSMSIIGCVGGNGVPPPRLDGVGTYRAVLRVLQTEIDDDNPDRDAGIQPRGKNICPSRVSHTQTTRDGPGEKVEDAQLYFVHHEKCLRRMTKLKMKPTIVHGT